MNTKRYASLITHMDRAIGRLLAELDRLGLRENTLVIFASDTVLPSRHRWRNWDVKVLLKE